MNADQLDEGDWDALCARAPATVAHLPAPNGNGATLAEVLTPRPFTRCLLGPLMAGGAEAPRMVHTWLYAGELTTIQAEPGVGKSWVALWIASHLIAAGSDVVYLDEEGGPDVVVERLVALGCDPADVDAHLWYCPFPGRRWDDLDVEALGDLFDAVPNLAVVVVDSMADFLAMAGMSEDSGHDVTLFCDRILGPVRAAGAALLVLDHLTKPDEQATKRHKSRYARGSGAKLAKASLTVLLEVEHDFDRNRSGALRMWKTKDRRGAVHMPALDQPPLVLDVAVADGSVTIAETERPATSVSTWEGPTRCMVACLDWLRAHPGVGFTQNQMADNVIDTTSRRGWRPTTIRDALVALADTDPDVGVSEGPRRAWLYSWTHPPELSAAGSAEGMF